MKSTNNRIPGLSRIQSAHRWILMTILLLSAFPCTVSWTTYARASDALPQDLTLLSLEELMNLEVTTVSKRAEKLSEAAAAVFVITQEDIRRSGATSIPEILRMAPGLQVAHIDGNKWAVGSRGFAGRFANKLLVLIDGRSVYTPLFSGVFWEAQDLFLEDIERIEIIRGPGAVLWGANAVNGVINIMTKKAKDTQGGLIVAGAGTEERGFGSVRFGSQWGEETFYRIYAKAFDRDTFGKVLPRSSADDWRSLRAGFRLDHTPSENNELTLQGDLYSTEAGTTYEIPAFVPIFGDFLDTDSSFSGGNALFRWTHALSSTSETAFQIYYDRTNAEDFMFKYFQDTVDLEFQHQFQWGERQNIVWGAGYRFLKDRTEGSFVVALDPPQKESHLFSAFIEDEVQLVRDRLSLSIGSKFEHNTFTGFEVQPSARLLWTPHARHSFWAAVSRAVRTPSRIDDGAIMNTEVIPPFAQGDPLSVIRVFGNRDFEAERLNAFEVGYRWQAGSRFSLDLTAFLNEYDDLRSTEQGAPFFENTPPLPPFFVIPIQVGNKLEGNALGVEIAADWQALKWWRIKTAYTFITMDIQSRGGIGDVDLASMDEGSVPHHQVSVRSWMDLPRNFEFDLWFRFVDSLPYIDVSSYATMDAKLTWKPIKNLEISLVGQNLLQNEHLEFRPDFLNTVPTEVERGVYLKALWRF